MILKYTNLQTLDFFIASNRSCKFEIKRSNLKNGEKITRNNRKVV